MNAYAINYTSVCAKMYKICTKRTPPGVREARHHPFERCRTIINGSINNTFTSQIAFSVWLLFYDRLIVGKS